jgi:hypothetical protein
MPTRYRILDTVDLQALHGQRYDIEVSPGFIVLRAVKPGVPSAILAQAIIPRAVKNGQPLPVEVTTTQE